MVRCSVSCPPGDYRPLASSLHEAMPLAPHDDMCMAAISLDPWHWSCLIFTEERLIDACSMPA